MLYSPLKIGFLFCSIALIVSLKSEEIKFLAWDSASFLRAASNFSLS
nr:Uncharacterized protein A9P81_1387 [Leptospira interrogans serovar Copenhageni/Icterohaemorrhagiae]